MNEQKTTGSYYTPHELVDFMVDYLKDEQQDFQNVLEPAAGDGRFVEKLLHVAGNIDAVELVEKKTTALKNKYENTKVNIFQEDFMEYVGNTSAKYSLIIGNPPYINAKRIEEQSLQKAKDLCIQVGFKTSVMQNMWIAFVIGACKLLKQYGTVFFVLPMEFLQVQYAEKLRGYLENNFNTIHIICFEEIIFKNIEQDICLVYLTNKKQNTKYILYKQYKNEKERKPLGINRIQKNKPLQKWSNAILTDEELTLLKTKTASFMSISDIGEIAPGVVTGGNKYFILSEDKVKEYQCEDMVLPIIQKSSFIGKKTVEINDELIKKLIEKGKAVYLLDLAKKENELPDKLVEYLEWAGNQKTDNIKLKERFKCANRKPWYGVPLVKIGEVVFFKRYDVLPRLYINSIHIHTTDAGYHIRIKEGYDAESMAFCFYNSMTLAECEYNGRYYGGGVRELVPSEFKRLTIPYKKISKEDIRKFKEMFKNGVSTQTIIAFVNSKILSDKMTTQEIQQFENIRLKLIKRRNRE